jgi:hypothetical protein
MTTTMTEAGGCASPRCRFLSHSSKSDDVEAAPYRKRISAASRTRRARQIGVYAHDSSAGSTALQQRGPVLLCSGQAAAEAVDLIVLVVAVGWRGTLSLYVEALRGADLPLRCSGALKSKFRTVVLFDDTAWRAVPPAVDQLARLGHLDGDLHGEWRAFVTVEDARIGLAEDCG